MGALCSNLSLRDKNNAETTTHRHGDNDFHTGELNQKAQIIYKTTSLEEPIEKQTKKESFSSIELGSSKSSHGGPRLSSSSSQNSNSTVPKPSNSPVNGSTEISFFGKTSATGIGKAVEVLDTIGVSVASLNTSNGFLSGMSAKSNEISVLAFEVANTIVKCNNLMQSLSMKNMKHLKEVVLISEGVRHLVSTDMNELLRLVAADKRKELRVLCREIIRFGNRCKDPLWHNLDHYFSWMESDFTPKERLRKPVHLKMENLMSLVLSTAELYHESRLLDKDERDYKLREGYPVHKEENLQILKQELNNQRKHVKSLKKKSLWSKNFEEVIMKLVDIVHFLHLEIHNVFQNADSSQDVEGDNSRQRLGSAGLALHYANIITQIDNLVPRASSIPQNLRDALYQGLPLSIKNDLHFKIRSFQTSTEELTVPKIKAEMEKTLRWLVPLANRTSRTHHGFGWVGEWANAGTETNGQLSGQKDLIKIETLYHADKSKTEICIRDLVLLLHHLVIQYKSGCGLRSPGKSPITSPSNGVSAVTLRSPNGRSPVSLRSPAKSPVTSPPNGILSVSLKSKKSDNASSRLTRGREEKEILGQVGSIKLLPGVISKTQDFGFPKPDLSKHDTLSKSSSSFLDELDRIFSDDGVHGS